MLKLSVRRHRDALLLCSRCRQHLFFTRHFSLGALFSKRTTESRRRQLPKAASENPEASDAASKQPVAFDGGPSPRPSFAPQGTAEKPAPSQLASRQATTPSSGPQPPSKAEPRPPNKLVDMLVSKDKFTPKPLGKPIGLPWPPKPGETAGERQKPTGTYRQRNMQRRMELQEELADSPLRDLMLAVNYHKGKIFCANERMFRAELARYFPNLRGRTLATTVDTDTTPVLRGMVSLVTFAGSQWGEKQVDSFVGKVNPEVEELLKKHKDVCQKVELMLETNPIKRWIWYTMLPRFRRERPEEDHGKFFILRENPTTMIRESIGLLNRKIGYIYLVDQRCKIRWAASADAWDGERENMTKCFRKMVMDAAEAKSEQDQQKTANTVTRGPARTLATASS